jgi:outer membrane receptor protein involved in Fe transport
LRTNKRPTPVFRKKGSVVATQFALMLMAAPLAFAQQTQKVEKVEVTGSRIQAPELEGASPVAVIRAEDIKLEGVRNVENLLNNMPQVISEYGSSDSNGATGTATVNLRNLGSDRTLVLVNGRRLPPGSPFIWAADVNQIPTALIKRVDILTGGASAVYGSDAIAGVVNFIMNDNFQGVQGEVNYSFYNHQQGNPKGIADIVASRAATNPAQFRVPEDAKADGETIDVSLIIGGNFDNGKGNATVFFGYKDQKATLQSERDFSACALNPGNTFTCGGSSTSYPGRFFLNGGAGPSRTVADAAGNVRPFVAATDQYNFGPINYFQRPSQRYSFDAFAHYDVAPNARVYSEFAFHDDHTVAQIAPSGIFGLPFTISGENPLLSSAWRTTLGLTDPTSTSDIVIARRNVEGGGRQDDLRHTSYRGVLGVKGDVFKHWNYDLYGQSGRVVMQEIYRNEFLVNRINNAIDVVTDPATGQPACRAAVNGSDPGCVPYNLWRIGGITPDALNYIQGSGMQKGYTSQTILGGTMSADLGDYGIKFPGAKSGVSALFGIERRVDELQLENDLNYQTGNLAGQGGNSLDVFGQISVKEFFLEGRMPIVEGKDWAHLLSVNGSYRRSDYSTDKKTNSYGIGIEYAPTKAIRARGSYAQAVRAPNVFDLFTQQNAGLYNNDFDPCAGSSPVATLAQCQRTGVSASQYGNITDSPAGQYNGIFGGNPDLEAETGKSMTLGLVVEPMANLSLSADYFDIKVEDVISTVAPPLILDQCLQTGNPLFCSRITRDSAGTLWLLNTARIVSTAVNVAEWQTSGIDFTANYTHKLDKYGSLNVNFIGTYLREFKQQPIPGVEYDCAGLFGTTCGVSTPVLPEFKSKLRLTWATPWNVDAAFTWRYISSLDNEGSSSNPNLSGPVAATDAKLSSANYIDLAATWRATKTYTVTLGFNNLLDKDPPIISQVTAGAPWGNGNTYPNLYDALGRKVFLTLTAKF